MKNRRIFITSILLIIIASFLFSCGNNKETTSDEKVIEVEIEKINKTKTTKLLELPGNIEGIKKVNLSTKLMGKIYYIPFEAGAKIKEGEVLVKIKSDDIEAKKNQIDANLIKAKASFKTTKTNYERIEKLYNQESASKKEFEDIETAYAMAKAQIKEVSAMQKEIEDVLNYAVIKAPFDGYIVNKYYNKGDLSAPGHPILTVENLSKFKVTTNISSSEINKIKKGDDVKIAINNSSSFFNGKITEINPGGNPASHQFKIEIELDKTQTDNLEIKSGMYTKVLIPVKEDKTISLHKNLIHNRGQLNGVYTINSNNEATLRWIRLGRKLDDYYEVLAGLREGEKVIKNIAGIHEGQKVEVIK